MDFQDKTLETRWDELGVDLDTIEDHGGTLRPSGYGHDVPAAVDLPEVFSHALVLRDVIGRGATGVVWAGDQQALARSVAVKQLADDNPAGRAWLLREARVTGALEHPNIVPVHDIVLEAGQPMIVMKRVEGAGWDTRLREDREALREDEFLEKHLRVLIQVSRAVDYAHARGVLHRDIKPENVMLGSYAEVYLVDWSIAVGLEDCAVPGLLKAAEVNDLFGTPAYMSPEMAGCEGPQLGPHSDVYVLGACLHEIIKGDPPHVSTELMATLARAWLSDPPVFDSGVPKSLVEICHRALARDPEARTQSAAVFADELEEFLLHRHSLALATEGQVTLTEFLEHIERGNDDEVATLYRESRLLFQQALRIWSGNTDAARGLFDATERRVGYELDAGRPDAAKAVLAGLEAEHPDLRARVGEALAKRQQDDVRLKNIAHDRDVSVGSKTRGLGAGILSVSSIALNVCCGILNRGPLRIEHLEYALAQSIYLAWAFVVVFALRKTLWATTASRQISFTSVLTIAAYVVLHPVAFAAGVPFTGALVIQCLLLGLLWVVGTAAFDRRMVALPVAAFAEIPFILLYPSWAFEIIAGGTGVGLVVTALLLRARDERSTRAHGRQSHRPDS